MNAKAIIIWLIVGAVAGWLAGMVVKGGGYGLIGNIIVGIVGGLIAGWLLPHIGVVIAGGVIGSIISAFAAPNDAKVNRPFVRPIADVGFLGVASAQFISLEFNQRCLLRALADNGAENARYQGLFSGHHSCGVDCRPGAGSRSNRGRLLRTRPDNGGTSDRRTTEIK